MADRVPSACPDEPFRDRTTSLESGFPIVEISQLAERESWRKEINRPLYHIHKWWATRLGSVFRGITLGALLGPKDRVWEQFYRTHEFRGRTVLDPFMGSGTTIGEALKLGCKAIGTDINPVSTFLVRQGLTSVSEGALRKAFARFEEEVATEIKKYYRTRDPGTGEMIPVLYFFWVKYVETPKGEKIPLFDNYIFSRDAYPKKKPKAQIICPNCWGVIEARYDSTRLRCPDCNAIFNPQQGPASGQYVTGKDGARYRVKDLLPQDGSPPKHRMYAMLALRVNGEKVYLRVRSEDEALFEAAECRLASESLPLPSLDVRPGHNTNQARGYNYLQWRDFFNARQLLALGLLLRSILRIEDRTVREQFLCLFSSTLEFNNMFCSFKGEGTGAVRHMFSNHILKPERTPLENSVWGTEKSSGTFSTLFESRLLRAKRYLREPFELRIETDLLGSATGSVKQVVSKPIDMPLAESWDELCRNECGALVLNGDGGHLPVPDRTVDAVITDPPYFDFVHYSELSDFFFAWLAPVLAQTYPFFKRKNSSNPNEVQHKNARVFSDQLARVFADCRRVLKDDGILAFSFHHSRPEGWAAIYEAIVNAGLEIVAAHPVHAELRGASPKSAAKEPISLDAILVCRKREGRTVAEKGFDQVLARTKALTGILAEADMRISAGDRFVIAASQLLVALAGAALSFDEVCERLAALRAEM